MTSFPPPPAELVAALHGLDGRHLIRALVEDPSHLLLHGLLQAADEPSIGGRAGSLQELADALILIFEAHAHPAGGDGGVFLAQHALTLQLRESFRGSQGKELGHRHLMRSNSLGTKVAVTLAHRVCSPYLRSVFEAPIAVLLRNRSTFEINPSRADEGEDMESNRLLLERVADGFLTAVTSTVGRMPTPLTRLCSYTALLAQALFPHLSEDECHSSALGTFFFLRFFCPAVVSPWSLGLLSQWQLGRLGDRSGSDASGDDDHPLTARRPAGCLGEQATAAAGGKPEHKLHEEGDDEEGGGDDNDDDDGEDGTRGMDFAAGLQALDKDKRRGLVMAAKLLQALANGVRFGAKEPFMAAANTFIDSKADSLPKFYRNLVVAGADAERRAVAAPVSSSATDLLQRGGRSASVMSSASSHSSTISPSPRSSVSSSTTGVGGGASAASSNSPAGGVDCEDHLKQWRQQQHRRQQQRQQRREKRRERRVAAAVGTIRSVIRDHCNRISHAVERAMREATDIVGLVNLVKQRQDALVAAATASAAQGGPQGDGGSSSAASSAASGASSAAGRERDKGAAGGAGGPRATTCTTQHILRCHYDQLAEHHILSLLDMADGAGHGVANMMKEKKGAMAGGWTYSRYSQGVHISIRKSAPLLPQTRPSAASPPSPPLPKSVLDDAVVPRANPPPYSAARKHARVRRSLSFDGATGGRGGDGGGGSSSSGGVSGGLGETGRLFSGLRAAPPHDPSATQHAREMSGLHFFRGYSVLDCSAKELLELLSDADRRHEYDPACLESRVIADLADRPWDSDAESSIGAGSSEAPAASAAAAAVASGATHKDIYYLAEKSPSMFVRDRDFCLLRVIRRVEFDDLIASERDQQEGDKKSACEAGSGSAGHAGSKPHRPSQRWSAMRARSSWAYVIFSVSVERQECPANLHRRVRGEIGVAGFVIQPMPAKLAGRGARRCSVVYVGSLDPKGWIPTWVVNWISEKQPLCLAAMRGALLSSKKGEEKEKEELQDKQRRQQQRQPPQYPFESLGQTATAAVDDGGSAKPASESHE